MTNTTNTTNITTAQQIADIVIQQFKVDADVCDMNKAAFNEIILNILDVNAYSAEFKAQLIELEFSLYDLVQKYKDGSNYMFGIPALSKAMIVALTRSPQMDKALRSAQDKYNEITD